MRRLGFLVVSWWVGGRLAVACSCPESPAPPCEAYWDAAAVFSGTVTRVSTITVEYPQRYEIGVNDPYYPIPRDENRVIHERYLEEVRQMQGKILFAGRLADYRYLPAAKADLLRRLGRGEEAVQAYRAALALTDNSAERDFLGRRIAEVGGQPGPGNASG